MISSIQKSMLRTCHLRQHIKKALIRSLSSSSSSFSEPLFEYQSKSCDLHIVESPFQPLTNVPNMPISEFVAKEWIKANGQCRNKTAIVDTHTGQSRTFRNYHQDMGAIASNLKHNFDISQNSTIALFSPNHVDYVPLCLAVAQCGAKLTPVNPQYKAEELGVILERSQSEVLFCHSSLLEVGFDACKMAKSVKHVIVMPDDEDMVAQGGSVSLNELKLSDSPLYESYSSAYGNFHGHPFLLPFSSGTTGLPKAVCLSHINLIANLLQVDEIEGMSFPMDQKLISPLPFFHIYGYLVSALYAAWKGNEVIISSGRFDLEAFCQSVEKYRPQRAHLVPPIIIQLAKNPIIDNYDLSSLSMIISAAAPLSADTEQSLLDRIGCKVKQAWGMSELSPIGTYTSDYNIKSGSVGQLVSSTYGKIIDPATQLSLGPGESGELMIKGPQVMMGYLNEAAKTAECLSDDGWLKTGDVAQYDEDGFFFITDRLKELIKVRGYQVAPAELEALLLTHPNISDAAVIPVEDEASGELPRAYITLKSDKESQNVTEEDIKSWVKERVAPFKRLEGGVCFIDQVPKSASGKIFRRILVERAREDN